MLNESKKILWLGIRIRIRLKNKNRIKVHFFRVGSGSYQSQNGSGTLVYLCKVVLFTTQRKSKENREFPSFFSSDDIP